MQTVRADQHIAVGHAAIGKVRRNSGPLGCQAGQSRAKLNRLGGQLVAQQIEQGRTVNNDRRRAKPRFQINLRRANQGRTIRRADRAAQLWHAEFTNRRTKLQRVQCLDRVGPQRQSRAYFTDRVCPFVRGPRLLNTGLAHAPAHCRSFLA